MEKIPKLVRDDIPKIIENEGRTPITRKLEGREFIDALKNKLVEEAGEVEACESEEMVGEMADVYEVLLALCETQNMTIEQLIEIANEKREVRGGFGKGIFLEGEQN